MCIFDLIIGMSLSQMATEIEIRTFMSNMFEDFHYLSSIPCSLWQYYNRLIEIRKCTKYNVSADITKLIYYRRSTVPTVTNKLCITVFMVFCGSDKYV